MKFIRQFFALESSGGILLALAALLALIIENSSLQSWYSTFLTVNVSLKIGSFGINKPLLLWINDGLMAVFFLLVGLEVKREILVGHLSSLSNAVLPIVAAIGGLVLPALIYIFLNLHDSIALNGWAIASATDIAFSLFIINILGKKIPQSLKICLVAIAILDDIAAIVIIAIFYTKKLSLLSLLLASLAIFILIILNVKKISNIAPYIIVGIFLWAFILKSGVHATLAGVALALFIPFRDKESSNKSPLCKLEHDLHPWVSYGVLPIFAFANAGVSFTGMSFGYLTNSITLGILLGLFFGKQLGVMFATFIGVRLNFFKLPNKVTWLHYYGMSIITGIGFTMSLFIATLAFQDMQRQIAVRIGVILASSLCGIIGYFVLYFACSKMKKP